MKYLLVILLTICFVSCSPFLKMVYGIKNPSEKTNDQVLEISLNLFEKEYELYRPQSDTAYSKFVNEFEVALPGFLIFDEEGNGISLHKDTINKCTANAELLMNKLESLNFNPMLKLKKDDFISRLQQINRLNDRPDSEGYNYSIILFWADFAGRKLNKEKPVEWLKTYNLLSDVDQSKIDLIIINMDFLMGMGK